MSADRSALVAQLARSGHALVPPPAATAALQLDLGALDGLRDSWERLPRDAYLRDGGAYRARRHSCYLLAGDGVLTPVPHRPHWQPTSYNALHGGLTRWFEPVEPAVAGAPAWRQLLGALGGLFGELQPVPRWHIEAHQFRIDTAGGIGRPTPEGAHRDGVDFVAVILIGRRHVRGGETRVFDANGPAGVRFTMEEPWTMLLMDDARVIHETTPIQADGDAPGARDTLVLTYRARGFQAPEAGGE
ncbi:MAG TPA: 2OG-Fe dioxygenase family protein [Steroidobacteraceae bacterium]|nr:2OG-Fe dioxygenase family protein [Steroidobacteraceae bacterium]